MSRTTASTFVVLALLLTPPTARAECVELTARYVLQDPGIDLVFSGRVVETERTADLGFRAIFDVARVWKGFASQRFEVYVWEITGEMPNQLAFQPGRHMVVVAKRLTDPLERAGVGLAGSDGWAFTTVRCSGALSPAIERDLGPGYPPVPAPSARFTDLFKPVMRRVAPQMKHVVSYTHPGRPASHTLNWADDNGAVGIRVIEYDSRDTAASQLRLSAYQYEMAPSEELGLGDAAFLVATPDREATVYMLVGTRVVVLSNVPSVRFAVALATGVAEVLPGAAESATRERPSGTPGTSREVEAIVGRLGRFHSNPRAVSIPPCGEPRGDIDHSVQSGIERELTQSLPNWQVTPRGWKTKVAAPHTRRLELTRAGIGGVTIDIRYLLTSDDAARRLECALRMYPVSPSRTLQDIGDEAYVMSTSHLFFRVGAVLFDVRSEARSFEVEREIAGRLIVALKGK